MKISKLDRMMFSPRRKRRLRRPRSRFYAPIPKTQPGIDRRHKLAKRARRANRRRLMGKTPQ